MFGLALRKALVYFRHDIVQALAQMRIVTKSFWVVFQAGWFLVYSPLGALVQLLTLGCADSQTQRLLRHPAFPLVHQLFSVRPLDIFYYMVLFISACADLMMRRIAMKYKTSATSSLH